MPQMLRLGGLAASWGPNVLSSLTSPPHPAARDSRRGSHRSDQAGTTVTAAFAANTTELLVRGHLLQGCQPLPGARTPPRSSWTGSLRNTREQLAQPNLSPAQWDFPGPSLPQPQLASKFTYLDPIQVRLQPGTPCSLPPTTACRRASSHLPHPPKLPAITPALTCGASGASLCLSVGVLLSLGLSPLITKIRIVISIIATLLP